MQAHQGAALGASAEARPAAVVVHRGAHHEQPQAAAAGPGALQWSLGVERGGKSRAVVRHAEPPAASFALQGDADFDGIPDAGGTAVLGKEFNGAGGLQPVIENVERLEFFYHLSDGRSLTTVNAADLPMIRSVTVSLLLRANKAVQRNSNVYYYPASNAARASTGKKWGPFSDNFMRQMAVTEIKLRNMGLIENI